MRVIHAARACPVQCRSNCDERCTRVARPSLPRLAERLGALPAASPRPSRPRWPLREHELTAMLPRTSATGPMPATANVSAFRQGSHFRYHQSQGTLERLFAAHPHVEPIREQAGYGPGLPGGNSSAMHTPPSEPSAFSPHLRARPYPPGWSQYWLVHAGDALPHLCDLRRL
eukprot:7384023-Prymnesium_polylepis.2